MALAVVEIAVRADQEFGAYLSKLEAAIPTGHGPDLFFDAHERISLYASRGLVEPLGEIDPLVLARFELDHLEALTLDEELYGLPLALKCAALYVNNEFFPEQITALAQIVDGTNVPGGYPLVFEAENSYYLAAFLHARAGALIGPQGQYTFEGPAAEQTIQVEHISEAIQYRSLDRGSQLK